jgi:hypothetical protein
MVYDGLDEGGGRGGYLHLIIGEATAATATAIV